MKLGVISDTHDNLDTARQAVKFLEDRVDIVVHCGDIVAPFTAEIFHADFDFYAVRGNNDGEWNLQEKINEFGEYLGEAGELEFEGFTFGIYHGTSEIITDSMTRSGKYDFVLRGHTHETSLREHGDTIEVNPGGIPIPGSEDPLHVAVIDLSTGDVELHEVA